MVRRVASSVREYRAQEKAPDVPMTRNKQQIILAYLSFIFHSFIRLFRSFHITMSSSVSPCHPKTKQSPIRLQKELLYWMNGLMRALGLNRSRKSIRITLRVNFSSQMRVVINLTHPKRLPLAGTWKSLRLEIWSHQISQGSGKRNIRRLKRNWSNTSMLGPRGT